MKIDSDTRKEEYHKEIGIGTFIFDRILFSTGILVLPDLWAAADINNRNQKGEGRL